MEGNSPMDLSAAGSPVVSSSGASSTISSPSQLEDRDSEAVTPTELTEEVQLVKKKVSKPSVLPTFLPPCRVCNAKASGFHYGVNTCEACKAFYRRSIGNEQSIKPCSANGQCADNPKGKISCSDCRHKKCLQLGMARQGCRKGRYTYEKRTQDTREFRKIQAEKVLQQQIENDQCQETVQLLVEVFKSSFSDIFCFINLRMTIQERVYALVAQHNVIPPMHEPLFSTGDDSQLMTWAAQFLTLFRNAETYDEGMQFFMNAWFFEVEKHFHGITNFAKQIPGFSDLLLDDRIILLKSARGDAMHSLRHHMAFLDLDVVVKYHHEADDLVLIPLNMLRQLCKPHFVNAMIRIISRMQKLQLTDEDIAVLLAFVICMPFREGLQFPKEVEKIQEKLLPVLQYTLRKNHPDQRNIVADTLLLLPDLCENSENNAQHFRDLRERINQDHFPLVYEMTQDLPFQNSNLEPGYHASAGQDHVF